VIVKGILKIRYDFAIQDDTWPERTKRRFRHIQSKKLDLYIYMGVGVTSHHSCVGVEGRSRPGYNSRRQR